MTTIQVDAQEKTHGEVGSSSELLKSFKPATKQDIADDEILTKLSLLSANNLVSVNENITILTGENKSDIKHTAGTIGMPLLDKQGDRIGAIFFKPNSKDKPIIINSTGYGSIILGEVNSANEVIAFDNVEDAIQTYISMSPIDKTIIASPSKNRQTFKQMVKHWGSLSHVTVPMTLDDKDKQTLLAGVNAQALISTFDIMIQLENGIDYEAIRAADDTNIINLKNTANYPEWRKEPQLNGPMIHNDGRFELYHDGLFFVKYDDSDPSNILFKIKMFICSPLEIIAKARDSNSSTWGRLLRWHDDDRVVHQWSMPLSLLQGDTREYRRELASQGLNITTNSRQRGYLDTYIQDYPIHKRALCVDQLGWHGKQYILPNNTLGGDSNQITVYQSANAVNSSLSQKGTLAEWRDELCKPLAEQSRLVFSICCAFSGQLLEPLGSDGGGFHIVGSSSMGKSISMKLAASVWGNPARYVKTWRSTDNAMESTASEYNDSFLPLDEISECDPKIISKVLYMLANGQGKGRSTTTGHNRKASTWRNMFLSNGEKSVQQQMAEVAQKTNAGVEIRTAHIEADAGKGYRMFDSLVLADSGAAQAEKLTDLSNTYYGTAGMAWLEYITDDKAATTATAKALVTNFMGQHSALSSQAHRVAKRFAIVAAAGEIATIAGITGWQAGQATLAVRVCLDNWLDNYGRDGEHEQRQIIKHIQAFIEKHGSSRFQACQSHVHQNVEQKIADRVGYRNNETGDYYFSKNIFDKEVCSPFGIKKVLQVLEDAKLLMLNQNDRKTYKTPSKFFKNRLPVYAVSADILSYETNKTTVTGGTNETTYTQQGLTTVPAPKTSLRQLGQIETQRNDVSQLSRHLKRTGTVSSPVNTDTVPLSQVSHDKSENTATGFINEHDDKIPPFGGTRDFS